MMIDTASSRDRDTETQSLDRQLDWPAVLLLLVALLTAASRLVVAGWTGHLGMAQTLVFLGTVTGLALGRSRFSPRLVVLLASAYGLFAIPWQLGLTLEGDFLWIERLAILSDRLTITVGRIVQHRPVLDPAFFLLTMSTLFWVLGAQAGYTLTRYGRAWQAALPAGLVTLVIQTSDPLVAGRAWFLAAYIFLTLLLLVRLTYLRHRARWQRSRIPLPFIGLDLALIHLFIAALLVLTAWTIPVLATALPAAEQAWHRATRNWSSVSDFLDDVFAPLRGSVRLVGYTHYGDQLSLGREKQLSDTLVLTVETPPHLDERFRYYWRTRVYDSYTGGQWSSTFPITRSVTPSYSGLTFPDLESRQTVTFTFTPAVPIATLFTVPQPLWVSRPAQADLAYNPDGSVDLTALHANPPLDSEETYQSRSSISTVTVAQLRAAGADYPEWVAERYLQIPSSVTTRTLELARQIALPGDNAYDTAAAVTFYLRTHVRYADTVPPVPAGREPLDWFLFDLREGFCNYYASAEVIMLRSLGIPARLAAGFAQGERQEEEDAYLVRQSDAHAWPEVYFPGLGWVEFEPTVSYPPLERPLGESPIMPPGADPDRHRRDLEEFPEDFYPLDDEPLPIDLLPPIPRSEVPWDLLLTLGLFVFLLAWSVRLEHDYAPIPTLLERGLDLLGFKPPVILRRWARYAALTPLERAYLELNRALTRLGSPPAPADTPAERALALTRLLSEAADPIQRLLAEFHVAAYSPRSGNLRVARQAARTIRDLSWRARIRRLVAR